MKRPYWVTAAVVALATIGVASAATLNPSQIGTTCSGTGVWHFVNNQTGGAAAGTLTATFSTDSGTLVVTTGPTTVLANVQHFFISTPEGATLLSAETDLPGRLILSELDCDFTEPPKCDPKTDPNQCKPPPK